MNYEVLVVKEKTQGDAINLDKLVGRTVTEWELSSCTGSLPLSYCQGSQAAAKP